MKKHLFIILILFHYYCKSQEYIIGDQKKTTLAFYDFLEANKPDSALALIDTSFIRINPNIKNEIVEISTVISTYHIFCEPVQTPFTWTDEVNITETIYITMPAEDPNARRFAKISLAFKKNVSDKIYGILIVGEDELKGNAIKMDTIPPPPPSPSSNR